MFVTTSPSVLRIGVDLRALCWAAAIWTLAFRRGLSFAADISSPRIAERMTFLSGVPMPPSALCSCSYASVYGKVLILVYRPSKCFWSRLGRGIGTGSLVPA